MTSLSPAFYMSAHLIVLYRDQTPPSTSLLLHVPSSLLGTVHTINCHLMKFKAACVCN